MWQVGPNDPNCDSGGEGMKHMSSSDDSIIRPGADTAAASAERGDSSGPESGSGSGPAVCPSSGNTTHTSFILKRQRHSSVPQTARTQVRRIHLRNNEGSLDGTLLATACRVLISITKKSNLCVQMSSDCDIVQFIDEGINVYLVMPGWCFI